MTLLKLLHAITTDSCFPFHLSRSVHPSPARRHPGTWAIRWTFITFCLDLGGGGCGARLMLTFARSLVRPVQSKAKVKERGGKFMRGWTKGMTTSEIRSIEVEFIRLS